MTRLLTIFSLLVLWVDNAYAYFDPGSGSLLLQLLVAGIIGFIFKFRAFLTSLVIWLRGLWKR